jgi:hypothetical protein
VTATKSGESDLENPARPSRKRMTARMKDERRNFGASYNFRVYQALGNLRTPRRFWTLVDQQSDRAPGRGTLARGCESGYVRGHSAGYFAITSGFFV